MKIGAVILAAGYSSRMVGDFKPLMQLGEKSLLAHCAALFREAGVGSITVVTGHRYREVEEEAGRLGLHCLHNSDHDRGMYSSVRTAMHGLECFDGFYLLPVDIPLIRPATLVKLLSVFDGKTVVLPTFKDRCGHPPLIPTALIPAILNYPGQNGLQGLLEGLITKEVPVWDRGIIRDCDRPEDFAVLKRREAAMDTGEPVEAAVLAEQTMAPKGVAHGRAVARAAVTLAKELNRHSASLDLTLVHNGALLHDIAKGHPNHERRGAEMAKELGLTRLMDLIAHHRDPAPPTDGKLSECEIVCLADKLVRGARRVSIRSRFEEKLALYDADPAVCRAIRERMANALALGDLVEKTTGSSLEAILGSNKES